MSSPASPAGTYLGFDAGARRLGVAVGESLTGSARPLVTLPARDGQPAWDRLAQLMASWEPAGLVVGLPLHADGSDSASTALARRLARRLEGRYRRPVFLVDERLSSHEAEGRLAAGRHPGDRDSVAAQIILETWFAGGGTP